MSQYGAYGYAQNGYTFDQIVAHYFPGTELTTTTVKSIRVLLATDAEPHDLLDRAVEAEGRNRCRRSRSEPGTVTLNPELKFKLPGEAKPQTFVGPLRSRRRRPRRSSSRSRTAARSPSTSDGKTAHAREHRAARAVPVRRRPVRDAEDVAPAGAEGAGRRRALVRARACGRRRAVRRLPRHAQPGVRRRERGEAVDDRRRRRDRRARCSRTAARPRSRTSSPRRAGGPLRSTTCGTRRPCRTSSPSPIPTTRSRRTTTGGRSP